MNGDAIDLTSPACTYLYLLRDGSENRGSRTRIGQFLFYASKFDWMFLFFFFSFGVKVIAKGIFVIVRINEIKNCSAND